MKRQGGKRDGATSSGVPEKDKKSHVTLSNGGRKGEEGGVARNSSRGKKKREKSNRRE